MIHDVNVNVNMNMCKSHLVRYFFLLDRIAVAVAKKGKWECDL